MFPFLEMRPAQGPNPASWVWLESFLVDDFISLFKFSFCCWRNHVASWRAPEGLMLLIAFLRLSLECSSVSYICGNCEVWMLDLISLEVFLTGILHVTLPPLNPFPPRTDKSWFCKSNSLSSFSTWIPAFKFPSTVIRGRMTPHGPGSHSGCQRLPLPLGSLSVPPPTLSPFQACVWSAFGVSICPTDRLPSLCQYQVLRLERASVGWWVLEAPFVCAVVETE